MRDVRDEKKEDRREGERRKGKGRVASEKDSFFSQKFHREDFQLARMVEHIAYTAWKGEDEIFVKPSPLGCEKQMSGKLSKTVPQGRSRNNGDMYIENLNKFEELLVESRDNSRAGSPSSRSGPPGAGRGRGYHPHRVSTAEESTTIKKNKARELLKANYQNQELENKKMIENSLQRAAEKKAKKFYELTTDISNCQDFLEVVDKSLSLHDEAARNKTRRQFEDWNTTVHGRIQSDITNQLNAMEYKELLKKRNQDYQNFLDITNKKPAIFRDIIIESEYDPLEPNRRAIHAKPGKLNDPTLHILQKAYDESAMLDPNSTKNSFRNVRTGRDTLDVEMWNSGKIEATPHGRFGKMMTQPAGGGGGGGDSIREQKIKSQRSNVIFDHYDFPVGKAAIDKEMPVGKRQGSEAARGGGRNPLVFTET
jgi:hypothetical protein